MVFAETLALDVHVLTLLSGTIVPILVGLVTKRFVDSSVKLGLNAALSAIAGGLTVAIAAEGKVDAADWLTGMLTAFGVSMATYHGFLKPTHIASAIERIAPDFGVGTPRIGTTIPIGEVADATVSELAEMTGDRRYDRGSLERCTRDELRDIAKDAEVPGYYKLRKAELIDELMGD